MVLFSHLTYKTFAANFNTSDDNPNLTNPYSQQHHYDTGYVQNSSTRRDTILPDYLQLPASYNLPDLLYDVIVSIVSSEVTYHFICGFLQVYFYVLKRGEPEKWKCQPHRFLTQSNEMHEIVVGSVNMFFAGGILNKIGVG